MAAAKFPVIICLFLLFFASCGSDKLSAELLHPESGVSLQLAQQRKSVLSRINYDLTLDIPAEKDRPIAAEEIITFDLSDKGAALPVDFMEEREKLRSLSVNGQPTPIVLEHEHVILPQELLKQGKNTVVFHFTAGDGSLNRSDAFLYSLFVPDRARTFIPCFDQPDLKASFTLTATLPADWEIVSNGPMKKKTVAGARKTCRFDTSDTISTYLFSVVAGEFEVASRMIGGRRMSCYYRETDSSRIAPSMDSIFELHRQSLAFMEDYTGIPYPFKKFDIVAIPDFTYGGMEHVGAIDYRADILFLDRSATRSEYFGRAATIAHETAHMWFGNLVTMKWFNDVWMKEVFANFMADKVCNSLMPDAGSDLRFLLNHHPGAYSVDRTEGANPIRDELDNLAEAGTLYGEIIYQKAPVVMRQLERTCGEKVFQRGLREYLKTYAHGNADWPGLIAILDRISRERLDEWNEQWINRPGRPMLNYTVETKNGVISSFLVTQKGEHAPGTWKQHFTVAFVYPDTVRTVGVNMNGDRVAVKAAEGMPAKWQCIVFNASGEGYGFFPSDKALLLQAGQLKDPLLRASAYINSYEQLLSGSRIAPRDLLLTYAKHFDGETNELILSRMMRQFRTIYWQFITPEERSELCTALENKLWQAIENTASAGKKRVLFQAYVSIALSGAGTERLYSTWKTEKAGGGLLLSEEDLISIAAGLALRKHPQAKTILAQELQRINNPDRKAGFAFVLPALSDAQKERDAFFASLSDARKREKEVWVSEALGYLHHPLRGKTSEKYLPKTLELLESVQATGDIFFPSDWLSASFGSYRSQYAADVVTQFLEQRPDYNRNLRRKILQETDDLFRARKILGHR